LVIEAATENPEVKAVLFADIDAVVKRPEAILATNTSSMGPLRLADLIGLDTLQAIADSMYAEHAEPLHAAPPLLRRMTAAGLLGRKTRRGFDEYSDRPGDGAGR
jgi:3-hydroxyacyl-CoA dehydrogenase